MLFIDVSSNNPHPIDWHTIKGSGIDGVIVKATEGADYVSPFFGRDYDDARAAGLIVGAYHFWHPDQDDNAQFDWFTQHYGGGANDFPAVLDAESNPTGLPWGTLATRVSGLCNRLASRYGDSWAYLNRNWAGNLRLQNRGVWLAQGTPGPVARAEALQFAPARIPGCTGLLDWSSTNWAPKGT